MYVNVLWKEGHDPLCCPNNPLESLPLCLGGVSIPDSDARGEDVLHQPSVARLVLTCDESQDNGVVSIFEDYGVRLWSAAQLGRPEQPDEVKLLLGILHHSSGVDSPGQMLVPDQETCDCQSSPHQFL